MAVYCLSDIHGRLDLLKKVINFLKEDDVVYFLGDAADRGPRGLDCIYTILNDKRFIYLKGNHEDLLVRAIEQELAGARRCDALRLWFENGGRKTYFDMDLMGEDKELHKTLNKLPIHAVYENKQNEVVYMSHAGFTPFLLDGKILLPDDEALIWDREHYILDSWPESLTNVVSIHGHTPTECLAHELALVELNLIEENYEGAIWYDNGHKLDIDTGAVWNNYCVLVDLDTWEQHIIKAEGEKS